ncbi:MAG: two component transcriptional regulator, LuxR family [Modestobacter sp.]|nr:two component transcriptional regulator, LuxR family [Modestobacter sp.]
MIRVLVVDDHEVVRTGLALLLGSTSDLVCVGTAPDGDAAVEMEHLLSPDVVLLDLSMPGRDGVSVTRALRDAGRQARVLVLTSYCAPDLVLDVVQAGADGYLLKESRAETILDGVRAVAAGGAPVDPAVARWLWTGLRAHASAGDLTDREREVLELVRQGHANKSIARRLEITERTVKAHVTHILQRLGVHDRTQAALWAERHLHAAGVPEE